MNGRSSSLRIVSKVARRAGPSVLFESEVLLSWAEMDRVSLQFEDDKVRAV